MAVQPSGNGAAWVEDVDVDQPHGLDYRYENHIQTYIYMYKHAWSIIR